jgi:hypothetical protein
MADLIDIEIDLTPARDRAERVREMLIGLRERLDLAPFEYCKEVRIAPTETPFSHPRITLSSFVFNELDLVRMYLHEQMHWYATWFSHAHPQHWRDMFTRLRDRYPGVPAAFEDGGAQDEASTTLHLIVNWLELEAVSRFFPRDEVERYLRAMPFYRWIYQTVIDDQQALMSLYREFGLSPIRAANEMSADDLELAARMDEAATS